MIMLSNSSLLPSIVYNEHEDAFLGCELQETSETLLYHIANLLFLLSYCCPSTSLSPIALMHCGLILGYLLFSTWAWNIICAPDVFAWYFIFMLLNVAQLLYILYQLRPIKLEPDLEQVFQKLFQPFNINRVQFKKLMSNDAAQVISLHSGECYAIEGMTRTDRLGLLLTGRVNVLNEKSFIHSIHPIEFLDSPEFESANNEDIFKVTVCAAIPSKLVVWPRAALDYLFIKEPYLAQVMGVVIAQDICEKLFRMNANLVTPITLEQESSEESLERKGPLGKTLDIRLPGIAGRLFQMVNKEHVIFRTNAR